MRRMPLVVFAALASALAIAPRSDATRVKYRFATTLLWVNPAAPGFPPSLAGISAGSPIQGVILYDRPSIYLNPNPFTGFFGSATAAYQLVYPRTLITVGGVRLDTWHGTPHAFVWNNSPSIGGNDGVEFHNINAPAGSPQYLIGSTSLPFNTIDSPFLPTTNINGIMSVNVSAGGAAWFAANWMNLIRAPHCPGDVDGDDQAGVTDLLVVISSWGPCPTCPLLRCQSDVSPPPPAEPDCQISVSDLLAVIGGWGPCP